MEATILILKGGAEAAKIEARLEALAERGVATRLLTGCSFNRKLPSDIV